MADVDIDVEVDTGDSESSLQGVNKGLGSLEAASTTAADGLGTLSDSIGTVNSLMHASDQRADDLARAQNNVAQAAADVDQANRDLKQSQLDVTQSQRDGVQAGIDLEQALLDQKTAQKEYNDAVKEYGADSLEAQQAAIDMKQADEDAKQAKQDAKQATEDGKQALQDGKQATIDAKNAQLELNEATRAADTLSGPSGWVQWAADIGSAVFGLIGIFALLGTSSIGAAFAVIGSWIAMAAASLLAAAQIAIAWIIASGGIILIVLALIALVAAVIIYWDEIKAAISDAWDWLVDNVFKPMGRFFTQTIPGWARFVRDKVVGAWNSVKSGVMSAVGTTVRWVKDTWNGLVSFFASIPGRIANGAKGMWGFITNGLKNALNGAIGLINDAIFFINDKLIANANRIPGVNIPWIPYVPFLAEGGVTTGPTMAMIGEGREQEAVLPLSRLESMLNVSTPTQSAARIQPASQQPLELRLVGGSRAFREFFQESVKTTTGGNVIKYVEG